MNAPNQKLHHLIVIGATGTNGGVGSVATALLAKLGYTVIASSGRMSESEHLEALGASAAIDRAGLSVPGKPLAKGHRAGVVDTVSSHTLLIACATTLRLPVL